MKTTAVLLIYSLSVVPTECFAPSNVVPAIASGASHNSKGFSPTRISASAAPIAWPDVRPTPSLDQPIRARIVAVAPEDMASPFKDREQAASWFEVRQHSMFPIPKIGCIYMTIVYRKNLNASKP